MDFFRHFPDFLDLIALKKGENRGIVAHFNRPIAAIESSFSKSDGPRFL